MKTPDGWNPMESAPKGRPILVLHVHESDDYYAGLDDGRAKLTPYGCHVESFSHVEDGPYVAEWGGADHEYDDMGRFYEWPDWWFQLRSDYECPLAPVGWLPIPGFTKPAKDTCKGCGAKGFHQSEHYPDRCDFCDNPDAD